MSEPLSIQQEVESVMSPLVGKPLWDAGRAADLLWLALGPRQTIQDFRGKPREVGEYALHVQCAWRFVQGEKVWWAIAICTTRADIATQKTRFRRDSIGTCRELTAVMKCWPSCLQAEQNSLLYSGPRRGTPENLHCCWKAALHCRYFPTIPWWVSIGVSSGPAATSLIRFLPGKGSSATEIMKAAAQADNTKAFQ